MKNGIAAAVVQGDSNQNLQIQMATTLKQCISYKIDALREPDATLKIVNNQLTRTQIGLQKALCLPRKEEFLEYYGHLKSQI